MGGTWRCRAETIKPPQASRWWRSTSPRRDARARSDNPGFVGSGIIKMMPNTSAAAKGCATEEKGAPYQTNCMASRARRRATVRPPPPVPVSGRERSAPQSTLPACQASAGPATSGQGRQPRSGGAGRDRLYRMAPVWSHGDKQVTTLGTLTAPTPVSCRNSIRCHQHRARCR